MKVLGLGLGLVFAVAAWSARESSAGGAPVLAFYDPDANHQAILNITEWFDRYLRSKGSELTFQPVHDGKTLDALIAAGRTPFAIVSYPFARSSEHASQLVPLLVPEARGAIHYRKVLLDRGEGPPGDLRGQAVASTVASERPAQGKKRVLALLAKAGARVDASIVIPVTKDVDALLALAFGQVRAALVTPQSLRVLERINPQMPADFRRVFETQRILSPPLCAVGGASVGTLHERLPKLLLEMDAHEAGRKALLTMGYERWVPFQRAKVHLPTRGS